MTQPWPPALSQGHVMVSQHGALGVIVLNRPQALHALSLPMVRDITAALRHWQADDSVQGVLLLGAAREGKVPAFCAGGDIRFFYEAAWAGDAAVDEFFTEEYCLDHLIHTYPKPTMVWMDGITMGGGMGLAQGARYRVVTEHSQLAMPETRIGLFPDVGGGWFLSRCPGYLGEYLALTGRTLQAAASIQVGLADLFVSSAALNALWGRWQSRPPLTFDEVVSDVQRLANPVEAPAAGLIPADIEAVFGLDSALTIVLALARRSDPFARELASELRERSPLMLEVSLRQVRLARHMALPDVFRLERGLVHQCLHWRPLPQSETLEGIRALVIDKDRAPRWSPAQLENLDVAEVEAFFESPWSAADHPLANLGGAL